MVLHVETAGDPAQAVRAVLGEIHGIDPAQPASEIRPLRDYLDRGAMFFTRVGVDAVSAVGACAVALALAGIYSLVSHSVQRKRREIGIRVAIGAPRFDIVRLFLLRAAALIVSGAGAGLGFAAGAHRLLTSLPGSMPPGIGSVDVWSFGGAAAVALTGLAAAAFPAFRAASTQPSVNLLLE
jgi:putative ABC transport system permease protein